MDQDDIGLNIASVTNAATQHLEDTDWSQLGMLLDAHDILDADQRFWRARSWGDGDADSAAARVMAQMLRRHDGKDEARIRKVWKFLDERGISYTKYGVQKPDVNNQGYAHSENPAPKMFDNFRFRSQPEISLYQELKARGWVFAPLPVFLAGGRVEPDFVILHKGRVFLVEIDGPYHDNETPLKGYKRLAPLQKAGAEVIRVAADIDAAAMIKVVEDHIEAVLERKV